jgi:copper homeostasis protein
MKIEICVDSAEGVLAAERGGADRVELCDNLLEGGTTPSAGCLKVARNISKILIHVIIRPRGGDFLYSSTETAVMLEDIRLAKESGADGVVIGCLTAEGDIDLPQTQALLAAARPMKVTFHRAFDMCRDPHAALEQLISLGIERVLTSGQEGSAFEGMELIATLQKQAAGRIIIMPGGGVTPRNLQKIVQTTGVKEIHMSARTGTESRMRYRNNRCFMGGALRPPEFAWKSTDERAVHAVVEVAQKL